jgi:hypothetical protein
VNPHRGCQAARTYNLPIFMEFEGKPKPRASSCRRIACKGYELFLRNRSLMPQ